MSIDSRPEKQTVSNPEIRIADAYQEQVQKINQDAAKQIQDSRNGAAAWDAAAGVARVLSSPLQVFNLLGGCAEQSDQSTNQSTQNRKSGDSGNSKNAGDSNNSRANDSNNSNNSRTNDANNSGNSRTNDSNNSGKKTGLSQEEREACQIGGAGLSEEDKKLCKQ